MNQHNTTSGFTLLEVLIALVIVGLVLANLMHVAGGSKQLAFKALAHIQKNHYLRASMNNAQAQYKPDLPKYPKVAAEQYRLQLQTDEFMKKPKRQTKPMKMALEPYSLRDKQGNVMFEGLRWKKLKTAR